MKTTCSSLRRIGFVLVLTFGVWTARLHAQPGSQDTNFNAVATTGHVGFSVAVQPDGKVIAVGTFGVMRFLIDGSVDPAFQPIPPGPVPFAGPGSGIGAVVLQPDGRIIVSGNFTNAAGTPLPAIMRLNSDGSNDPSFNADPAYPGGQVLALQPDGKILTAGLVRLHSNGSLDAGFDTSWASGGDSLALAPDGKIYFRSATGLHRANPDGSRDGAFEADESITGGTLALQPDGKLLVGGYGDGPDFRQLRRLLTSGAEDPDWSRPAINGGDSVVYAILVQPDGKVLVGGNNLEAFNGVPNAHLGRLNSDGSTDTTFDTGAGLHYYSVEDMALAPDGKVVAVGYQLNRPDLTPAPAIWRLNNNAGPRDIEFTASAYVAREGDGWVSIPVRRTGAADRLAIVRYSAHPGSATRGRDYFGGNGTLLFKRGETIKHIRLYIVRDHRTEGFETVRLSLERALGGKLGPQRTATLTILD